MNTYTSLVQLISDLEELKLNQNFPIKKIKSRFIEAMEDKMVFNYQEVLSKYTEISEDVIANFDRSTILAYLTSTIRSDRFFDGALAYSIQSGLVLAALKRLSTIVDEDISN